MSSPIAKAARRVTHELHGVVVSAGLMQKTVKVRVGGQKWNKIVNKHFPDPKNYLVHDPNSSLRTGDVVSIVPGWPTSQHKRHVVKQIIAPRGVPIEERPPVPTLEERIEEREAKKAAKDARRLARRQAAEAEIEEQRALKAKKKEKAKEIESHIMTPPVAPSEGD
ncbi:hypothetical protein N3K66_001072 [Trichothecium roseum]|uniref:Uncharacterized protein n=1 Tax=Trichothecium roseum TaxID=47278 RepID=A0ACC0VEK6_9HYPO|nr:hypothetical protein N3K66_001072 [Trichothecium roseum]